MINIGITGSSGLLGWHLRCATMGSEEFSVACASRSTFESQESLLAFAAASDVIVHFAGRNRGEDDEVFQTNTRLTEQLISAIDKTARCKHVVFSSSTHISRDTSYGRSKRKCSELLAEWSRGSAGRIFSDLVLPNIFGEGGKPFYNSVISTFCHQIANHQTPEIKVDAEIEVLHSQRVADIIFDCIRTKQHGQQRPTGVSLHVSTILDKLQRMYASYASNVLPSLNTSLDLDLFNTLRSYLYPSYYPVRIPVHTDARGGLFEVIKGESGGQTFVSSTKPGVLRGNHFHRRKVERFLVISGTAEIRVRKLFSHQTESFVVDGSVPAYIDIPTLHTHNIKNIHQNELTTVFWAHEIFNPACPDTVAEPV